jgi:methylmalonyl-CoA mutase C-terminal domain/subunit
MRDLNRQYSYEFNIRHDRVGTFLRKRYGSRRIEDGKDLVDTYAYVVLNPVAEGFCRRPEDWRWSSYRTTAGLSDDFPFVDAADVIAEAGGSLEALRRTLDGVARARLERHVRNQVPDVSSRARLRAVAGKIRVVVAKPGLDGHDRGAKIIARALRDAGMEVIYTGLHQTPEQIVETAIQEDADAVGISILSGAHMTLVPRILELLRENGVEDVVVVVGGTIPDDDAEELRKLGVAGVFGPGAPTTEIVDFLKGAVAA